jgi:hypothetical protein
MPSRSEVLGDGSIRREKPLGMSGGFCQLSRHKVEANDVDRLDLGYAAAIVPINWANRSR